MPKNVVCKKCNNLVNGWCGKVIDSPDQDMQRACQYFCEKTRADKIRAMSDEELAEFLCDFRGCDTDENTCIGCKGEQYCRAGHVGTTEWLKQPAEEE